MEDIAALVKFLETKYSIKVIVLSLWGSKVWGTDDENSDNDIRFIFKRDVKDYIRIESMEDSFVGKSDDGKYDWQGYDIIKAVTMFSKSNAAILELLKIPPLYEIMGNDGRSFLGTLREYIPRKIPHIQLMCHNSGMSRKNLTEIKLSANITPKMLLHGCRTQMNVTHYLIGRTFEDFIMDYGDMLESLRHELPPNIMIMMETLLSLKKTGKSIDMDVSKHYVELLSSWYDKTIIEVDKMLKNSTHQIHFDTSLITDLDQLIHSFIL